MEKMTYEEFRNEAIKKFHKYTDKYYTKEEIEQFIENYEEKLKKDYLERTEMIKDGDVEYYDTSGLAYIMDLEI